ncbi:hypothetical protein LN650_23730 [Klebsiella pneumoniae subsp. pneumoniae]|nr:hypothetical protein [Klebsiella pneumoniae subsp. pneumoniae]
MAFRVQHSGDQTFKWTVWLHRFWFLATLPDGIPVMAMIGDSHAALFAHGLGAADSY